MQLKNNTISNKYDVAAVSNWNEAKGFLEDLRALTKKFGSLLIFDEVMTGFGRTGRMFGYEHWNVEADIIALSKGMAAGYAHSTMIM